MLMRTRQIGSTRVLIYGRGLAALLIFSCVFLAGQGLSRALADDQILYVKGSNVNIRSGPGTDTEIVAKLNHNHKLAVLSREGRWFQVKLSASGGKTGWIREDLTSDTQTERRKKQRKAKPPSVAELSSPAGVVVALEGAPAEKVVEAFQVAIKAAGKTCGTIVSLTRRLVQPEGVYYFVGCKPATRYSVLVKPDGKMGTEVTLCDTALRVRDVELCKEG